MRVRVNCSHCGNYKLQLVKAVKEITGIGLKEAEDAVDSGSFTISIRSEQFSVLADLVGSNNIWIEDAMSPIEVFNDFKQSFEASLKDSVIIPTKEHEMLKQYKKNYESLKAIVKEINNTLI